MRNKSKFRWQRLAIPFFLCALVAAPHFLFSEEGLFRAKDSQVPGAVEIAGESVMQMVILRSNPDKIPHTMYRNYLSANPQGNFLVALMLKKIQSCLDANLSECEIPYDSYGTAFVTDNGMTLWTAKHVVKNVMGPGQLVFELYNSDGEKVFDTTDRKDSGKIELVGDPDQIQKQHADKLVVSAGLRDLASDFAKISLNHPLAVRSLTITQRLPQSDERLYAIGYANMGLRKISSVDRNSGERARVAMGTTLPYNSPLLVGDQKSPAEVKAFADFAGAHYLAMNMDGLPGQSGSPVMNVRGEVVGIFVAGNATLGAASLVGIVPHFKGILDPTLAKK